MHYMSKNGLPLNCAHPYNQDTPPTQGCPHYCGFTVVVVSCFLCLPWLCLVVCCLSTSDPFPVLSLLGLTSVKCVFGVVGWWGEEGDSVAIHQSVHVRVATPSLVVAVLSGVRCACCTPSGVGCWSCH